MNNLKGAPVTLTICWIFGFFLQLAYLILAGHMSYFPYKDWKEVLTSFEGWKEFLYFGVPGMLMICSEWWGYEIHTIVAGWNGEISLAAQTILLTSMSYVYMFVLGVSVGATTLVGNRMGAGKVSVT